MVRPAGQAGQPPPPRGPSTVAKKFPRRRKVTPEEAKLAHKQLTAALAQELPKQGMGLGLRHWRKQRGESERFASRMYAKYLAAGGEEGTGKPFIEWLKSVDWAKVLEFVMKLVATFGAIA